MSDTTPTTTAVSEAGILPALRELATASREATELDWQRERAEQLAIERREAVRAAGACMSMDFPATLAPLIQEADWTGYSSLEPREYGVQPTATCAVVSLGEGVWLHHADVRGPYVGSLRGQITLLIPCACGNYRQAPVDDDYALARELEYADATRTVCLGLCTADDVSGDEEADG